MTIRTSTCDRQQARQRQPADEDEAHERDGVVERHEPDPTVAVQQGAGDRGDQQAREDRGERDDPGQRRRVVLGEREQHDRDAEHRLGDARQLHRGHARGPAGARRRPHDRRALGSGRARPDASRFAPILSGRRAQDPGDRGQQARRLVRRREVQVGVVAHGVGHPMRAVDRHREPVEAAGVARAPAGPRTHPRRSRRHRARPPPPAVRGPAGGPSPRPCRRRRSDAGPPRAGRGSGPGRAPRPRASVASRASFTAARAASRSGAPRKWNATDGPFASTYSQAGRPSRVATPVASASATGTWRLEARLVRGHETGRIAAARQPAGLQAVVPEVLDPTDPDRARRHRPRSARSGSRRATRSGCVADRPASRRRERRARGSMAAADGSPEPRASVPSKSDDDQDPARAAPGGRPAGDGPRRPRPPRTVGSRRDGDARQDRLQAASHDVRPDAAQGAVADDPVGVDPEVDRQRERVPRLRRRPRRCRGRSGRWPRATPRTPPRCPRPP